jgi:hypothetical protein
VFGIGRLKMVSGIQPGAWLLSSRVDNQKKDRHKRPFGRQVQLLLRPKKTSTGQEIDLIIREKWKQEEAWQELSINQEGNTGISPTNWRAILLSNFYLSPSRSINVQKCAMSFWAGAQLSYTLWQEEPRQARKHFLLIKFISTTYISVSCSVKWCFLQYAKFLHLQKLRNKI